MSSKGLFAVVGLILALAAPHAAAQDSANETGEQDAAAKKKTPFNLYVFAGFGSAEADTLDGSVETGIRNNTSSLFTMDENDVGRAVIGWEREDNRGDFRLIFTGFSETSYEFDALGRAADLPTGNAGEPLVWWRMNIRDGILTTELTQPQWALGTDDANNDMQAQQSEVSYGNSIYTISRPTADNLQNRTQTFDLVYGRKWGKPPLWGARYFAGARYFVYEGTVPVAAYTASTGAASLGFSDGFVNPLLNFRQESEAYGPVGQIELHLNFAEGIFQFYGHLETAFVLVEQSLRSGGFNSFVSDQNSQVQSFPGRLSEDREKTSWHLGTEVGFRVFLPSGLELEAGYFVNGYLDSVLLPPLIQVPATASQGVATPPSAVYTTQDLEYDGFRAGLGFQF